MCALHSKPNAGLACAPQRARAAPHAAAVRSVANQQQRLVVAAASKWKVFGPTNSYSDGDAEFFRLSNSLAQQHEWFAPRPEDQEQEEGAADADAEQDVTKPLYGLTPQQIAALGLSGSRVNTPDPVCVFVWGGGEGGTQGSAWQRQHCRPGSCSGSGCCSAVGAGSQATYAA